MDLNQVTLPCVDYRKSVEFYVLLGLRQIVDSPPQYARFETASGTTLSIHLTESANTVQGAVVYFEVADVDAEVRRLREAGLEIDAEPADQRWLWREAYVSDPAGNSICVFRAGENRRFPPWRI